MSLGTVPGQSDQTDMRGASMDDLPGGDRIYIEVDANVDAKNEGAGTDALEDAQA